MATEYKIKVFSDFLAVPEDKLNACVADFRLWLDVIKRHREIENTSVGGTKYHALEDGSFVRMMDTEFVWVDDGQVGLSNIAFHLLPES